MKEVIFWLARIEVATFVRQTAWAWTVLEIVHFLGLSMLLGTSGSSTWWDDPSWRSRPAA